MTQYEAGTEAPSVSTWALAGITFAATMMVLIGVFQAIGGLNAIIEDDFYVATQNYLFDLDVSAWGWIHLILGIVVAVSGYFLFLGRTWAGIVALTLAMLSAIANFFFIPYYPFWSLLIIALCIWVIWSLTRPGTVRT
jgi:hypothetical protein